MLTPWKATAVRPPRIGKKRVTSLRNLSKRLSSAETVQDNCTRVTVPSASQDVVEPAKSDGEDETMQVQRGPPQTYSRRATKRKMEENSIIKKEEEETTTRMRTRRNSDKNGNDKQQQQNPLPTIKEVENKKLLNDWSDDDDPEISFKDENLVIKSPTRPQQQQQQQRPALEATALLKKAATVTSTTHLEEELAQLEKKTEPQQPPKKRSIFKSKTAGEAKKGLSLYKHKWNAAANDDDFKREVFTRAVFGGGAPGKAVSSLDFPGGDALPVTDMSFAASKLVRVASAPSTSHHRVFDETGMEVVSVKCPKEQKEYYTVIQNVKKAHQIQDSGEFQEFNDDVEYILDGLGVGNNLSTRCLSTVTLASKCMEAGFRMHLRAHGRII